VRTFGKFLTHQLDVQFSRIVFTKGFHAGSLHFPKDSGLRTPGIKQAACRALLCCPDHPGLTPVRLV
jgi:hypothetical protein